MESVLRSQIEAKRSALKAMWTRIVWADVLPPSLRKKLTGPDAFNTLMQALAVRVAGAGNVARRVS